MLIITKHTASTTSINIDTTISTPVVAVALIVVVVVTVIVVDNGAIVIET